MKKAILGCVSLGLMSLFLFSSTGFSWGGGSRGESQSTFEDMFFFKAHGMIAKADELGLTEKQQEDIKSLKMDVKKQLIRQDAEIDLITVDIKQQMYQDSIDVNAVGKLLDQKYDLKKIKAKYLLESISKLKQVLSDEQRNKLKTLYKRGHSDCSKS